MAVTRENNRKPELIDAAAGLREKCQRVQEVSSDDRTCDLAEAIEASAERLINEVA